MAKKQKTQRPQASNPPTDADVNAFGEAFENVGQSRQKLVASWIDGEYARQKQKYTLEHDLQHNADGQLFTAACVLLRVENHPYDKWPWSPDQLAEYLIRPLYEQYIIAGALLCSENRRIESVYHRTDNEQLEDQLQQQQYTNNGLLDQIYDNVAIMVCEQPVRRFANLDEMKQIVGRTAGMLTDRLQAGMGGQPKVLILIYDETRPELEPHACLPAVTRPVDTGKAFLHVMTELKNEHDLDQNGAVIWARKVTANQEKEA